MTPLPTGKLPPDHLQRVIAGLRSRDPHVLIGPGVGEDAAVVQVGDTCLVITTDPITFAADRIGWYAVHVNANDVAVMGARPRWFLATVLLPAGRTEAALVDRIIADIAGTCESLGITVCGGHTEITTAVDRPIVVGQMIGEAPRNRLVRKPCLQPGDRILVTRAAAIEGTAILAREARPRLTGRVGDSVLDEAARLLFDPGISIVEAALTAAETGCARAMHDATEGGILTALVELGLAAGVGLRVSREAIPVLPATRVICGALGLDPLRLIASGALLIGVPAAGVGRVAGALAGRGIPVAEVAEICARDEGFVFAGHAAEPLVPAERDELARFFEPSSHNE